MTLTVFDFRAIKLKLIIFFFLIADNHWVTVRKVKFLLVANVFSLK